jgi:hypothetical protein
MLAAMSMKVWRTGLARRCFYGKGQICTIPAATGLERKYRHIYEFFRSQRQIDELRSQRVIDTS